MRDSDRPAVRGGMVQEQPSEKQSWRTTLAEWAWYSRLTEGDRDAGLSCANIAWTISFAVGGQSAVMGSVA